MIAAKQKRKDNIAEYLLYMWQIEDLIRACHLDIEEINRQIISQYQVDEDTRCEIREWYEGLIMMMRQEHVEREGHIQICKNVLIRLRDLHLQLLAHPEKFATYQAQYYQVLPLIVELRAKQPESHRVGELETGFNALYGVMVLHLRGTEVTPETINATKQIAKWLGMLAEYYREDESKPLFES